jgi:hypothetical protein
VTEQTDGANSQGGKPFDIPKLPPEHIRYYQIADLFIKIISDLPIKEGSFHSKFANFEIPPQDKPDITLQHHFYLPKITPAASDPIVYQSPPWLIFRQKNSWIYLWTIDDNPKPSLFKLGVFSPDHSRGEIFNQGPEIFEKGHQTSLSLFPSDQIILGRVLADHRGCFLHASGMILSGQGVLFAGHSEAGKSTIIKILRGDGEILCDDRMIVRRMPEGFKVFGTWSHGEIPQVSPNSAPLKAILFLEQAPTNALIPMKDPKEIIRRLLFLVIKPLVTSDWWEKTLSLIEKISYDVPCYTLKFDKSGEVQKIINEFIEGR